MKKIFADVVLGLLIALAVALGIAAALLGRWPDERDPEWFGPVEGDEPCPRQP